MAIPDDAAALGRTRSLQVRRRKMAERAERAEIVYRVSEATDLAPAALETALTLIEKVAAATDTLDVATTLDAQRLANAAETIHRISRLASGQSTSNVAHAGDTDRAERIAELRARLAQHDGNAPAE